MKEHNLDEKVLSHSTADDSRTPARVEQTISDLTKSYWQGPADARTESLTPNERLVEASHRIKQLNNELHKPGGALSGSDLELIGFDKKGRLLLIHRNDSGKVDGKFLVDGDSGNIVARTKPGNLDVWEKSRHYDESGQQHPEGWQRQPADHGTIWRDDKGQIREVRRATGDVVHVDTDATGKPTMARMGDKQWPLNANDKYPHAEILPDGTLQVSENPESRWCALPNGATVHSDHTGGHWMAVQTVDAYGNLRVVNRDKLGAPVQITILNAGGESEVYQYKDTVAGISSQGGMWVKQPEESGAPMSRFMIEPDGSLKHYVKANQMIEYKTDGSMISTGPDGKQTILRPPFGTPGL